MNKLNNTLWLTQDYSELLYLNKLFLRGLLPGTLYNFRALFDDSLPLVDKLLQLRDYRISTHGGKRSFKYIAYNDSLYDWPEVQQRPHLSFAITEHTSRAVDILDKLLRHLHIVCIVGNVREQVYFSNTLARRTMSLVRGARH